MGDIYFVRGRGTTLQNNINRKINSLIDKEIAQSEEEIDIIIVSRKDNKYPKLEKRDNTYMVKIDDINIGKKNYIPVLELLTFALNIVYQDDFDRAGRLYKKIMKIDLEKESYQEIRRHIREKGRLALLLTLPPAVPIDLDKLGEIYRHAVRELMRAA